MYISVIEIDTTALFVQVQSKLKHCTDRELRMLQSEVLDLLERIEKLQELRAGKEE
jgi:hypothetical protein